MRIALLASARQKIEILAKGIDDGVELLWVADPAELGQLTELQAIFDFEFRPDQKRTKALAEQLPSAVLVNCVEFTLDEIGHPFIRFNGWPGSIGRPLVESAVKDAAGEIVAKAIFQALGWPCIFVPDTPGLISARIIAMVINEAYFVAESKISSREEIDIAMKLGTNYPFGPFDWARQIGLENIASLLEALSKEGPAYLICPTLLAEARLARGADTGPK